MIIQFPRHKWIHHSNRDCMCAICIGGLAACSVCGGAEGALPTDCPGYRMECVVEEDVYDGKVDYRAKEGWVQRPAKHWERMMR